jgi:hypothetical protein
MARIGKAQRALDRAHEHRQKIEQLLAEPDCLRPWFLDWAESQLKRDRFYIYSETEHASALRRAIAPIVTSTTKSFLKGSTVASRLNFRSGNYCTWSESAGMLPAWMCHSKKIWKPPQPSLRSGTI